jgi:hypothetical protein
MRLSPWVCKIGIDTKKKKKDGYVVQLVVITITIILLLLFWRGPNVLCRNLRTSEKSMDIIVLQTAYAMIHNNDICDDSLP